jgi:hypothetical protein
MNADNQIISLNFVRHSFAYVTNKYIFQNWFGLK